MRDKYLIDANVFITAHRQLYPFDIAPSFWEQLVEKASDRIVIIKAVDREIRKGKEGDLLFEWYEREYSNFTVLGVLTLETYDAESKRRVKIPNVCREFGIAYIDLLQFMREIGIRL